MAHILFLVDGAGADQVPLFGGRPSLFFGEMRYKHSPMAVKLSPQDSFYSYMAVSSNMTAHTFTCACDLVSWKK